MTVSTLLAFPLGGAAFVVLGGWFLVRGRRRARAVQRFLATAVPGQAVVLDLRRHTVHNPDGPDGHYFSPVVRFVLPDGRVVEAETMHGRNPPPARVGEGVEVRYDPAQPTRVDLAHGSGATTLSCLTVVLGVGLILFGLLFVAGSVALYLVLP